MGANTTVGVAVLGLGGRGRGVVKNLLDAAKDGVRVVAVYDPDGDEAKKTLAHWGVSGVENSPSASAAVRADGVDWVMVFSPNARHKEQILEAFAAGRHVFTEKPLATTIEDCQAIYEAHMAHPDLRFATGFVLRYAPIYRRAKELLSDGSFGNILSVDANENITPSHGGYIVTNWRRHLADAGPHILEKCCHDLDLLNWICGALPSRVASFAGVGMFLPENEPFMERYGAQTFTSWDDGRNLPSPFTADHEMKDNQVAIMEYRNGIRVQFQATMANAIPERRMYFSCTKGTLEVELYASRLRYRRLGEEGTTVIDFGADGHGGGDRYIMRELYETMTRGIPPRCGANEGLESAVVALAIDEASRNGQVVDLEPTWKRLNR